MDFKFINGELYMMVRDDTKTKSDGVNMSMTFVLKKVPINDENVKLCITALKTKLPKKKRTANKKTTPKTKNIKK